MHIAVALKRVIDPSLPLRVEGGRVVADIPWDPHLVDPASRVALEVVLCLRDGSRDGPARVLAVTAGPPEWEEVLRFALARGVDEAVRVDISQDAAHQPRAVAIALATHLRDWGPDLIMMGSRSLDLASGRVPALLAAALDVAFLDSVVSVGAATEAPGWLVVERRLARGDRERARCAMPALLAMDPAAAREPLYVSWRRLAGVTGPVTTVPAPPLPVDVVPDLEPPRPRVVRKPSGVAGGGAMERLAAAMTGGLNAPPGGEEDAYIEGEPAEVAARIVEYLREKGLWPLAGRQS